MNNLKKPKIIVICGPTGVGKTACGIRIAQKFSGEIISADSMQVYRYMDIGTAKPTPEERKVVAHHLIDVVDPNEPFDAATYSRLSQEIIFRLNDEGVIPFVVGGTGLYIRALIHGLFRATPPNPEIRLRLKEEAEKSGLGILYKRLMNLDPEAAKRIHPNDTFRIIRALETYEITGKAISKHHQEHRFSQHPFEVIKIGLIENRDLLYQRINIRVDKMLEQGFLKEVEELLERGFSPKLKSMQSIGYRHMIQFMEGNIPWEETIRILKRDTRRYAKRQLTWFQADPDLVWKSAADLTEIEQMVTHFLNS